MLTATLLLSLLALMPLSESIPIPCVGSAFPPSASPGFTCLTQVVPTSSVIGIAYCGSASTASPHYTIIQCENPGTGVGVWTDTGSVCTCIYNATLPTTSSEVNNNCGAISNTYTYSIIPVGTSICGPGSEWWTCVSNGYITTGIVPETPSCSPGTTVIAYTTTESTTTTTTTTPTTTVTTTPAATVPAGLNTCNSTTGFVSCFGLAIASVQLNTSQFCSYNTTSMNTNIIVCNVAVNDTSYAWGATGLPCSCPYLAPPIDPVNGAISTNLCHALACNGVITNILVGQSLCAPSGYWLTCLSAGYSVYTNTPCVCGSGPLSTVLVTTTTTTAAPLTSTTTTHVTTTPALTVAAGPLTCNSTAGLATCFGSSIPSPQAKFQNWCSNSGVVVWCNTTVWVTTANPCNCLYSSPPADNYDGEIAAGMCHILSCSGIPYNVNIGTSVCGASGTYITCLTYGYAIVTSVSCSCGSNVTTVLPTTTTVTTSTTLATTTTLPTTTSVTTTPTTRLTTPAPPDSYAIYHGLATPVCYNIPFVGSPFDVCVDASTPAAGCVQHPTTGLYYLNPPTRVVQAFSQGSGPSPHYYCWGSYGSVTGPANTNTFQLTSAYDINPNCPCAYIGNGLQQNVSGSVEENAGLGQGYWFNESLSCNGDTAYCSLYNGSWSGLGGGFCTDGGVNTHAPGTGCVCKNYNRPYTLTVQYLLGGTWVAATPVDCYMSVTIIVQPNLYRDVPIFGYSSQDFRRRSQSLRASLTVAVLEGQTLIVNTPDPTDTRVSAVSNGVSGLYLCSISPCLILLPDAMFYNPGSLDVKVYINDTLDDETFLPYVAYAVCQVPSCVFCQAMVSDFGCFPWEFQAFVILVCIVCFLLIVILLYKIICGTRKMVCCKGCGKSVTNKFQALKRRLSGSRDDGTTDIPMTNTQPAVASVNYLLLILLFLPLVLSQSCASGVNIPVVANSCTETTTTEECSLAFTSLIGIPAPGLSACLSFTTPAGAVLGTMVITYNQMIEVAPVALQYVTAPWVGGSYSVKQCPWTDMCGSCASYNPITNPSACPTQSNGELDNFFSVSDGCVIPPSLVAAWPGMSRCDSTAGCAPYCIICDDACQYSHYFLQTSGPMCEVYKVTSLGLRPQVTVNLTTNGESTVTEIDVISTTNQVGSAFTLTIEGSLQGITSNIDAGYAVQCTDGFAGFGNACAANQPIKDSFGDIQGDSYSSFNPQGWIGNLKWDPNIVTPLVTATVTNYLFAPSGFSERDTLSKFPTLIGSTLWSMNGPAMYGVNSQPGELLMTLQNTAAVSMTRKLNKVCVTITSGNMSGCFACAQGGSMQIYAHSRCLAGAAVVTSTDECVINTPSVNLQTADTLINVRFSSAVSNPTCIVTFTSTGSSDSITLTGDLVQESLLSIQNGTFSSNATPGAGLSLPDLSGISGWFNGLASWAQGLVVTAIVIAAVIGAVVVIYVVFRLVKSYRLSKQQDQTSAVYDRLASSIGKPPTTL